MKFFYKGESRGSACASFHFMKLMGILEDRRIGVYGTGQTQPGRTVLFQRGLHRQHRV